MQSAIKARWVDLCCEAALCEDPKRLARIAAEIITVLQEEELRLEAQAAKRQHTAA
jgi:hypothetical protein